MSRGVVVLLGGPRFVSVAVCARRMFLLILLSLLPSLVSPVIVDPACTTNGKFDLRAVNCANVYPDAACAALYGAPPTAGTDVDRSPACYASAGVTIDHELKSLSSEICARQCGYCCQSPAYNCQNSLRPRIACEQVTHRMCRNPMWAELLAEDCPNVCGFCERNCVDVVPDCEIDKTICRRLGLEDWVKTNCRRTCGYCDSTTTGTTSALGGSCTMYPPDNNPKCAYFKENGFCSGSDVGFIRQHCATTCKFC